MSPYNQQRYQRRRRARQRGAIVLIIMAMLMMMMLVCLAAVDMATLNETVMRNQREKLVALQAARAALADAELDIEGSPGKNSRSSLFSPRSTYGFMDGCGRGDNSLYQGMCQISRPQQKAVWQTVDIGNPSSQSPSVAYGRFTDRTMQVGDGPFPQRLPRYLIELMPDRRYIGLFGQTGTYFYRITAIGFGADPRTQSVVQSIYRKTSAHAEQESQR